MRILIRTALSILEALLFAHINLGSCQSSPAQSTNALTSGGNLLQNIKQTRFAAASSTKSNCVCVCMCVRLCVYVYV